MLEFAGGWNISGDVNNSMDFDERVFRLQNQLGVSVLFTWGVIAENNSNHIAIVPGGWNEEYLDDSSTYLKVDMTRENVPMNNLLLVNDWNKLDASRSCEVSSS